MKQKKNRRFIWDLRQLKHLSFLNLQQKKKRQARMILPADLIRNDLCIFWNCLICWVFIWHLFTLICYELFFMVFQNERPKTLGELLQLEIRDPSGIDPFSFPRHRDQLFWRTRIWYRMCNRFFKKSMLKTRGGNRATKHFDSYFNASLSSQVYKSLSNYFKLLAFSLKNLFSSFFLQLFHSYLKLKDALFYTL